MLPDIQPKETPTTPATIPKTTPKSLDMKVNLPEDLLDVGGINTDSSNEILDPYYTVVETATCESFGNPKETMVQPEPSLCKDLAEDGFRSVCKGNFLSNITLIHI